jgi:hypothetical protein
MAEGFRKKVAGSSRVFDRRHGNRLVALDLVPNAKPLVVTDAVRTALGLVMAAT